MVQKTRKRKTKRRAKRTRQRGSGLFNRLFRKSTPPPPPPPPPPSPPPPPTPSGPLPKLNDGKCWKYPGDKGLGRYVGLYLSSETSSPTYPMNSHTIAEYGGTRYSFSSSRLTLSEGDFNRLIQTECSEQDEERKKQPVGLAFSAPPAPSAPSEPSAPPAPSAPSAPFATADELLQYYQQQQQQQQYYQQQQPRPRIYVDQFGNPIPVDQYGNPIIAGHPLYRPPRTYVNQFGRQLRQGPNGRFSY